MEKLAISILEIFHEFFPGKPLLISSPGRINLIGEHTDYNNGFVLPAAINKQIIFAIASNNLEKVRLVSADMSPSRYELNLSAEVKKASVHWVNYILGILEQLKKSGKKIRGFDCVFGGNIPIGAGLSSSAALEGGILFGLNKLFKHGIPKLEMAKMAQRAENDFVGVNCGIMDQFANFYGKKGEVILLDCKTVNYNLYPAKQKDLRIVLFDTKVQRELASSEYNERRHQCEEGVRVIKQSDSSVDSLREVSDKLLEKCKINMSQIVYQRCRYVIEENQRVLDACRDLENGNTLAFGKKMYKSHKGLKELYEVSCDELDILVEATIELESVLGARMMGGGFGGCTINIVKTDDVEKVIDTVSKIYEQKTKNSLEAYVVNIAQGTSVITSDTFEYAD